MGWASPHAGSEAEAVAAWGRPAPDRRAAILADSIRCASSAVIRIPLLSPSFSWKLRSSRRRRRRRTMQEKEDIFYILLRRGKSRTYLFDLVIGSRFSFFLVICFERGTWVLSALIDPTLASFLSASPIIRLISCSNSRKRSCFDGFGCEFVRFDLRFPSILSKFALI